MLVDKSDVFLKRMARTVANVRQKEGPLAGAVRVSKLNLSKGQREKMEYYIVAKAS